MERLQYLATPACSDPSATALPARSSAVPTPSCAPPFKSQVISKKNLNAPYNDFSELEKDFVNPDSPHLFFKLKLLEI